MKLFTKTFGCQMNFADSDEMGDHLKKKGFQPTDVAETADAILVNTCTVRDLAEHKAESFIGRLRDWKDENPKRVLIVTGCAAERAKKDFKRKFPFIDFILGAKDIEVFPKEFDDFLADRNIEEERFLLSDINPLGQTAFVPTNDHPRPSSVIQYVTIMRGCNYNCTYCIVPSVRGREVYRTIDEILSDVDARIAAGAKEVWLLGQTVNSYRPPNAPFEHYDFSDLLRDVSKKDIDRVRFISPHPYYLTPKLIDVFADEPKICEYMHLPVQSGSNTVLQKMKRNYTRESYLKAIRLFKEKVPQISITTDIIVGFPGETDADFEQTLSLVQEAQFDSAYCFKYSPRPGTVSATFDDDVPEELKESRVNHLLEVVEKAAVGKAQSLVGSTQEVLIEDEKGDGVFRGKTRTAWRVRVKNDGLKLGDIVKLKITDHHSRELFGEMI